MPTPAEEMVAALRGQPPAATHEYYPPGPDVISPLMALATGGLHGLAKQRGYETPEWSDRLASALQNPEANAALGVMTPIKGIRAYHGSPYDFEKFDISKIGTGEGAQAYGHGLYFAENEGVAKSYRDSLKWKGANWADPEHVANYWLNNQSGGVPGAIAHLRSAAKYQSTPESKEAVEKAIELLEQGKVGKGPLNPGYMYEVNINADPGHFLDWDKPMREQGEQVRKAISGVIPADVKMREIGRNSSIGEPLHDVMLRHGEGYGSIGAYPESKLSEVLADPYKFDPRSGEQIWRTITQKAVRPEDLRLGFNAYSPHGGAEMLREAGIPGIRYADQGSRNLPQRVAAQERHITYLKTSGASEDKVSQAIQHLENLKSGEGTKNYTVFNDKLIDILRKYGLAGVLGGGTAAAVNQPSADDEKRRMIEYLRGQ